MAGLTDQEFSIQLSELLAVMWDLENVFMLAG